MIDLKSKFSQWNNKRANVWITTLSVLFVIFVAISFYTITNNIPYLSSQAAPLWATQNAQVTSVTVQLNQAFKLTPGATATIGKTGLILNYTTKPCGTAQSCQTATGTLVVSSGTQKTALVFTAGQSQSTYGYTITMQQLDKTGAVFRVVQPPANTPPASGSSQVISPAAGAVWQIGKTYTIQWTAPQLTPKCDPGQMCPMYMVQALPVTITLDPPLPPCATSGPVRCEIAQQAPYTIVTSTPNSGSYTWTIPSNLPVNYIGSEQITISTTGLSGGAGNPLVSGIFTISKDISKDPSVIQLNLGQDVATGAWPFHLTYVGVTQIACTDSIPGHCIKGADIKVTFLLMDSGPATSGHQLQPPTTDLLMAVGETKTVMGWNINLVSMTSGVAIVSVTQALISPPTDCNPPKACPTFIPQ